MLLKSIVALSLLIVSMPSKGTAWLKDSVEYEGLATKVLSTGLYFPSNEKIVEIRRTEQCSAKGGPKANWKVEGGRLYLVSLFRCGNRNVSLDSVYGGSDKPLFADWITADIVTYRGKPLCRRPWDVDIYERRLVIRIEKGYVANVAESDNSSDTANPTVEYKRGYVRKLLSGIAKLSEADEEQLFGIVPCLR